MFKQAEGSAVLNLGLISLLACQLPICGWQRGRLRGLLGASTTRGSPSIRPHSTDGSGTTPPSSCRKAERFHPTNAKLITQLLPSGYHRTSALPGWA